MNQVEPVDSRTASKGGSFLDGLVGYLLLDPDSNSALRFDFEDSVAQVQLQLSGHSAASASNAGSLGSWLALSDSGEVVASGLLIEPLATPIGDTLRFDFNPGQAFSSLLISGRDDQDALEQAYRGGLVDTAVHTIDVTDQPATTGVAPSEDAVEIQLTAVTYGSPPTDETNAADPAQTQFSALPAGLEFEALATSEQTVGYVRPFADNAPWNVAVEGLARHAESDRYVDLLWNGAPDRPGNFNIGTDGYTYPVYEAQPDTPLFRVNASTNWGNLDGEEIP